MEIIHRGVVPVRKWQTTCAKCGTIFRFEKSEAQSHFKYEDFFLTVVCPVCEKECEVMEDNYIKDAP